MGSVSTEREAASEGVDDGMGDGNKEEIERSKVGIMRTLLLRELQQQQQQQQQQDDEGNDDDEQEEKQPTLLPLVIPFLKMPTGQVKFVCIGDLEGWGYSSSDVRGYLAALSILQVTLVDSKKLRTTLLRDIGESRLPHIYGGKL